MLGPSLGQLLNPLAASAARASLRCRSSSARLACALSSCSVWGVERGLDSILVTTGGAKGGGGGTPGVRPSRTGAQLRTLLLRSGVLDGMGSSDSQGG